MLDKFFQLADLGESFWKEYDLKPIDEKRKFLLDAIKKFRENI